MSYDFDYNYRSLKSFYDSLKAVNDSFTSIGRSIKVISDSLRSICSSLRVISDSLRLICHSLRIISDSFGSICPSLKVISDSLMSQCICLKPLLSSLQVNDFRLLNQIAFRPCTFAGCRLLPMVTSILHYWSSISINLVNAPFHPPAGWQSEPQLKPTPPANWG